MSVIQSGAPPVDVDPRRQESIGRLKKRRDFWTHVLVFALVNLVVWSIWAITGSGFPWPVFLTAGWGVGVVMNAWEVYRPPVTEEAIERELERMR